LQFLVPTMYQDNFTLNYQYFYLVYYVA